MADVAPFERLSGRQRAARVCPRSWSDVGGAFCSAAGSGAANSGPPGGGEPMGAARLRPDAVTPGRSRSGAGWDRLTPESAT